jgi:hypothetical protein
MDEENMYAYIMITSGKWKTVSMLDSLILFWK